MKRKKTVKRVILLLLCMLLSVYGVYSVVSSYRIRVVHYTVEAKLKDAVRVVHLTDLHNHTYGNRNQRLVDLVAEQEPDVILITGDMLNRSEENLSVVENLVSDLSKITDVYYGLGNHEYEWLKQYGDKLYEVLENSGATVLENDFVDISIKGNELRIGGYSGYYGTPHMVSNDEKYMADFENFRSSFESTERTKILLSHIPTTWLDWRYIDKYDVDFVFSGHYHGGEIKLPFIGGVYAPYVGFFPEYTEGVYYGEKGTCVLSAGLGSEHMIRWNNPPQLVTVDLFPDK